MLLLSDYDTLLSNLEHEPEASKLQIVRHLCRNDLFFLLYVGCGRADMYHQWLLDRCNEVQAFPDSHLDLWAREHYKSTIITFGLTLQDILSSHGENPNPKWEGRELTASIFSFTRPSAKGFLRQIKREFEANEILRGCFPDIIWENPQKDAPKWSEDDGLILRRKTNPKESTLEAWGVVDGQPTGKHFLLCVYDDVVTVDSIRTPTMIDKVTEAWELSTNLGTQGGRRRYIGTRYHFNDTYRVMMSRGVVTPRLYTPYDDGTMEGTPVLKTKEELDEKRATQGPYTFATQMMQNPLADEMAGFKLEWLRYYDGTNSGRGLNTYLMVDPANEKKKGSDYTVMLVIGLGSDSNYYLLDAIRDRLNLTERARQLMLLHRKWKPKKVGYEHYGMQADIQHIEYIQGQENYRFKITQLGGATPKNDRIRTLIPICEQNRLYLPRSLHRTLYNKKTVDLIDVFIQEEYLPFPVPVHDDMFDCMARMTDPELGVVWPKDSEGGGMERKQRYSTRNSRPTSCWAI